MAPSRALLIRRPALRLAGARPPLPAGRKAWPSGGRRGDESTWKAEAFRYVALSADHRVTDGALGARFLAEVRKFIENPISLLV